MKLDEMSTEELLRLQQSLRPQRAVRASNKSDLSNLSVEELKALQGQLEGPQDDKIVSDEFLNEQPQEPMQFPSMLSPRDMATMRKDQQRKQVIEQMPEPESVDPMKKYASNPEAELGAKTRIQFALEPNESNRRALLADTFGAENLLEDKSGDLYLIQEGMVRPINTAGLSQADLAEFAGALPEMGGTGIGAGIAGPAGAAGGAAIGNLARMGLSEIMGTPQVAKGEEIAGNVALAGLLGGAAEGLTRIAKNATKSLVEKLMPEATERSMRVISEMDKVKVPKEQTALQKLRGKPIEYMELTPTTGQKYGGTTLSQEKILMSTPFWGRKIRKAVDEQSKVIYKGIKDEIGDFTGTKFIGPELGVKLKENTTSNISALKRTAGNLFQDFEQKGSMVNIDPISVRSSLLSKIDNLKLFNSKGKPLKYVYGATKLNDHEHESLQRVLTKVIKRLGDSKKPLNATSLNNMRIALDKSIDVFQSEFKDIKLPDAALLKVRSSFMDAVEGQLRKSNDFAATGFKIARDMWSEAMKKQNMARKLGLDITNMKRITPDEKVLDNIFSNSEKFKMAKELFGEDMESLALSHIEDTVRLLAKGGEEIPPTRVLNALLKKKPVLVKALGEKKMDTIENLLNVAVENNIPVNPSMTAITQMQANPIGSTKSAIQLLGIRKLIESGYEFPKSGQRLLRLMTQKGFMDEKRMGAFPSEKPKKRLNLGRKPQSINMENYSGLITEENRPVEMTDSGDYSPVMPETVEIDGKFYNIPTYFKGEKKSLEDSIEIIKANDFKDPETNRELKPFNSMNEAKKSATERVKNIGIMLDPRLGKGGR